MKTDHPIYLYLRSGPEAFRVLTGGLQLEGAYKVCSLTIAKTGTYHVSRPSVIAAGKPESRAWKATSQQALRSRGQARFSRCMV